MKVLKISLVGAFIAFFSLTSCKKNETVVMNKSADSVKTSQDSAKIMADKEVKAKAELASLPKPYHPEDNASQKIEEAVKMAKASHKNVMIQAGGNWCIWCLRFNKFVQDTPELKNLVDQNYIYYHLNYSPENKNEAIFEKYNNPGKKYGYPVFLVLDENGKLIHTQDSAVLEDGNGYSLEKVKKFFTEYAPKS